MPCPECFDGSEEYAAWVAAAVDTGVVSYCLDCTLEYKAEMMAAGRCEWPEVRFWFARAPGEQEWQVVGVRDEKERREMEGAGWLFAGITLPA